MRLKLKKRNRRYIQLIVLAILLFAVGWFVHVVLQKSAEKQYGISLGYTLPLLSSDDQLKRLENIKALGFTEVRYNIDWSIVQPSNDTSFDWKRTDVMLKNVRQAGLQSIVTLDRTPHWARSATCVQSVFCPPAKLQDFATFSGAAVKRYQGYDVVAWEIWNEPNIINFWASEPDPQAYADMLRATYPVIKQYDSSTPVISGGLAGNASDGSREFIDPRTFLRQLYADGAKNYLDGVGYHPYTNLTAISVNTDHNGWLKMIQPRTGIRDIMVSAGDSDKDVWLTEFGTPTDGTGTAVGDINQPPIAGTDHVTELGQQTIAAEAYSSVQTLKWVRHFDWYSFIDLSSKRSDSPENHYGILRGDNSRKPVVSVFQQYLRK